MTLTPKVCKWDGGDCDYRFRDSGQSTPEKGRYKATWKREFKQPWREAGPPNYFDDKVDSDQ